METPKPRKLLTIGKVALSDLIPLIQLEEGGIDAYPWLEDQGIPITDAEKQQLEIVQSRLANDPTHLLNEATIWARAIYPLLLLAERNNIRAWAEVALAGQFSTFEISGIADGALGRSIAGRMISPYLVVVETKRGIEGADPIPQLYGQMLAAAYLNWKSDDRAVQEIFGCYTIADSWTFLRGEVSQFEAARPMLKVEYSREYSEKYDAETILKILKQTVDRHLSP
ncbi:MAG: hypothetical protein HC936_02555 [Leptolyngbyaceae cyanobacterium SU_3_3]|nr:hypothetical protein [Leptolyngbyaceae cyanobacterium SU_3_3]